MGEDPAVTVFKSAVVQMPFHTLNFAGYLVIYTDPDLSCFQAEVLSDPGSRPVRSDQVFERGFLYFTCL